MQKVHFLYGIILALLVFIGTREWMLRDGEKKSSQANSQAVAIGSEEYELYKKEPVKNTLTKASSIFQQCYLDYLQSDPVAKNVSTKLDWQIQKDGTVLEAGVISTDSNGLSDCLVKKVEALRFPPPPGGSSFYIAHDFHFKTVEQIEKERKEREEMEKKYKPAVK